MTVSCTANYSSTAGTAYSANRIIHFLGDSGKEIVSHLTTVSRKGCEVRLKHVVVVKNTFCISLAAFSNCKKNTKYIYVFLQQCAEYTSKKQKHRLAEYSPVNHQCNIDILFMSLLSDHFPGGSGCDGSGEHGTTSRGYGVTSCQRSGCRDEVTISPGPWDPCCFGTPLLLVTYEECVCVFVCVPVH